MARTLNKIQAKIAELYENGEYSYITCPSEVHDIGDSFFTFLISEASDVRDGQEFLDRLDRVLSEVNSLRSSLHGGIRPEMKP